MALIGSIRKRTGLLIGVIAVAMFAFLLMDGLSSRSRMGGAGNQNVGKIGNQKISAQYFSERYTAYESRVKTLYPGFEMNEAGQAQVREAVWNEIAGEVLLGKNMEKMGLDVSLEELGNAMYGSKVDQNARNILSNPNTGQYDPTFAYNLVQGVENKTIVEPAYVARVNELKGLLKETLIKQKYSTLFNKGMFVPDFLAKEAKQSLAASADVSYIFYPYRDVADEEVTVSDKELHTYLAKNAETYKKDASREVQIYKIDIIPSARDTADALKGMQEILADFRTAPSDSMFVRKYSEGLYDLVYLTEDKLIAANDINAANYFTDEVGTYYEPTFGDGAFTITKLTERKMLPDSVKARHILLPQPQTYAQVDSLVALGDSLLNLIKEGADFDALAAIHSVDESNKAKGGDLGYFSPGAMVQPFNDACFYVYGKGDVFKVVSQFGLHIVRIDEAKPVNPAVRLAKVTRTLKYSNQTEKDLLKIQNEFRVKNSTPAQFESAAESGEYTITTVNLTQNQTDVQGLGSARELVQWAFKEDVGSIDGFDINDQYIVAYIKSETKEGLQPLTAVKGEITQKVLNEKKGAFLSKKVADAGAANLQELASKTNTEVKTNSTVNLGATRLEGSQEEPKVGGVILGLGEGQMSKAISGTDGVYVVQLNSKNIPAVSDEVTVADKRSLQVPFNFAGAVEQLKDDANIKDLRFMYY